MKIVNDHFYIYIQIILQFINYHFIHKMFSMQKESKWEIYLLIISRCAHSYCLPNKDAKFLTPNTFFKIYLIWNYNRIIARFGTLLKEAFINREYGGWIVIVPSMCAIMSQFCKCLTDSGFSKRGRFQVLLHVDSKLHFDGTVSQDFRPFL